MSNPPKLNTEFGKKEPMSCSSLGLREKIRQLKSEYQILHSSTHKGGINTYVLGELMLQWIMRSADSTCTVEVSVVAALEREMTVCFLSSMQ
jgi:hypothetical protein